MLSKIKSFTTRHPKLTCVIAFALGGILTLSVGFLGKIFAVPASAVKAVTSKIPGAA